MTQDKKYIDTSDPYFEEVKSKPGISFDFVLWFYRILKYWYLFVISIAICLGIAYIQNKSWVPSYSIQSMMMLEPRGTESIVSGSVPTGTVLRNAKNQQIVLESRGLVERTVKKLPKKMYVDYFTQSRFKRLNLYDGTPVEIEIIELKDEAYKHVYTIAYEDETKCRIFYEGKEEGDPAFSIVAPYDREITSDKFTIKAKKTKAYVPNFMNIHFNFLTEDNLMGIFNGRIRSNLLNEESSALVISMGGLVPQRDIDFMDSLLIAFQEFNLDLKNSQADLTIDFLGKQLNIIKDSLAMAQVTLDAFQQETGIYEISSQALRTEVKGADKEKEELMLKEKILLAATEQITGTIMTSSELISPSSFGVTGPEVTMLERHIDEYNKVLSKAHYIGDKHPGYLRTVDELNTYRRKILEELRTLQSLMREEKDILMRKYLELDDRLEDLSPLEREMLKYKREYDLNLMYYQYMKQKRYEAQIQRASNTPDNFVLEEPRISGWQVNAGQKTDRYMNFFILGLLLPLAFVILKEEVFNNTLATKEECERLSGFPVIGTIENVSKKLSNGTVLVRNYPKSSFAESFRNMRIRIEYMAQRENNIVVLVTSAEPADGKTFIATNIASVYQLMGKKVVIVDLDLRRPSVSKTLNIDTHRGVSNYLIGQVKLEEIILSHADYGFDIIPAGTLPPNPSELIKTAKTKELIEYLKTVYDYVIIDCSPVGLVSDAYILAKVADTTMFVVRRAKTNKSFFKSVVSQIKNDDIEHVALVFNDVKGREGYYGTSRYYGDKTYYLKKNSYYHDDYFEN